MDSMVRVEAQRSICHSSIAQRLRLFAVIATAAVAAACGGGSGDGGGNGGGNPETGQIEATVVDQFDAPVNGVRIEAEIDGSTHAATTGSDGTATVTQVPTGSVSVTASADGLVSPPAKTVNVSANATATVNFVIERVTQAAGGVTDAVTEGPCCGDGSTYTFRIRVLVIDQNFEPVPNLTAADFSLQDCDEAGGTPSQPNCIRGDTTSDDADYTVANATPTGFQVLPPEGPVPYAAALLLDSSDSIKDTDPTDARIFANKAYLDGIGSNDRVMLAAFADDAESKLPEPPLTIFPCDAAPCPAPEFTSNGASLFPSLDALATLEGGGTPLYDSVAQMLTVVDDTADALPSPPANLRRAVVLFSDAKDIYCDDVPNPLFNCTNQREDVVEQSEQLGVDIVTIGLGANVDSMAMAELALRGRGSYLFADNSTQLIPIYSVLGQLLSKSLPTYEMVWTVNAAAGTFGDTTNASGQALIGRLTVDAGSTSFTLPFAVQIQPQP
jgi:hypothetical protein